MGETCTAVFLFAEIMENYTKNEKFLQFKAKNRAFRFFFCFGRYRKAPAMFCLLVERGRPGSVILSVKKEERQEERNMISFSQKEIKELERKTGLRITDKDSLKAAILHNPAVAVWYRKDAEAYVSIQELRTLVDAAFGKAENLPEAKQILQDKFDAGYIPAKMIEELADKYGIPHQEDCGAIDLDIPEE